MTKVTMKNGDLLPALDALMQLGREKFPIRFSFKLKKLMSTLSKITDVYTEARNEIIEEFAKRDDKGEKIIKNDGAFVELTGDWQPKMNELDDIETDEVEGLSTTELISNCETVNVNIEARTLLALEPLLVDDLEEKDPQEAAEAKRVRKAGKRLANAPAA